MSHQQRQFRQDGRDVGSSSTDTLQSVSTMNTASTSATKDTIPTSHTSSRKIIAPSAATESASASTARPPLPATPAPVTSSTASSSTIQQIHHQFSSIFHRLIWIIFYQYIFNFVRRIWQHTTSFVSIMMRPFLRKRKRTKKKKKLNYHYYDWKSLLLPCWQIFLALIVLFEIWNCWEFIRQGWENGDDDFSNYNSNTNNNIYDDDDGSRHQRHRQRQQQKRNRNHDTSTSESSEFLVEEQQQQQQQQQSFFYLKYISDYLLSYAASMFSTDTANNETMTMTTMTCPVNSGESFQNDITSLSSSTSCAGENHFENCSYYCDSSNENIHESTIQAASTFIVTCFMHIISTTMTMTTKLILVPLYTILSSSLSFFLRRQQIIIIVLTFVEMIVRARIVQQHAYESAALDVFETKLGKLCTTSVRLMSFRINGNHSEQIQEDMDHDLARKALRIWGPVVLTLICGFALIPWGTLLSYIFVFGQSSTSINEIETCSNGFRTHSNIERGGNGNDNSNSNDNNNNNFIGRCCQGGGEIGDPTLATIWITNAILNIQTTSVFIEYQIRAKFWKWARHWIWRRPFYLIHRIQQFLQLVRFVRFAGPIFRMVDKFQAHFRQLVYMWNQRRTMKNTRLRRIVDGSRNRLLLQQDIRRVASLERMNSSIRRAKSRIFKTIIPEKYRKVLQPTVGISLEQEKKKRLRLHKKVENLEQTSFKLSQAAAAAAAGATKEDGTRDIDVGIGVRRASTSWQNLGDVYDQLVDLTQEVKSTVHNEVMHSHLIAPNTRFSVMWRAVVSTSLLLELWRLWASWTANGDYTVPLADALSNVLISCNDNDGSDEQSQTTSHGPLHAVKVGFSNFLHHVTKIHHHHHQNNHRQENNMNYGKNDKSLLSIASQCHNIHHRAHQLGHFIENAIDVVCFFDIFVWFYTGEIDIDGNVVPKPFFSRCILPGTLVQVFDHPTLPTTLPLLLYKLLKVSESVGYSRAIRWGIALEPVITKFIIEPIQGYFLSPSSSSSATDDDHDHVDDDHEDDYVVANDNHFSRVNVHFDDDNGNYSTMFGGDSKGQFGKTSITTKKSSSSSSSSSSSAIYHGSFVY